LSDDGKDVTYSGRDGNGSVNIILNIPAFSAQSGVGSSYG